MAKPTISVKPVKNSKAVDPQKLPAYVKRQYDALETDLERAAFFGFGNTSRPNYDTPSYNLSKNETKINRGNAWIVFGVDRPHNLASGYGGRLNSHCASIDLVAGRMGARAVSQYEDGEPVIVNPNFKLDAARIYISQKSNVDKYFGLKPGTVGNTSALEPRSTVALKADTLRFIARENIKLITHTDRQNSQGGTCNNAINGLYGIDLMANNDDRDMQPLVKGTNLTECLKETLAATHDLRDIFLTFCDYFRSFIIDELLHTHYSAFFGSPTSPDINNLPTNFKRIIDQVTNVETQCYLQMQRMTGIEQKYISAPAGAETVKNNKSFYILSKFNNTN
tara:strand:+ start:183 stop:1193 length:1011 start_codon:yes stop_codon:yes gene_type:complete